MRKSFVLFAFLIAGVILALTPAKGASSSKQPGEACSLNLSCNARQIRLGMRATLELSLEGEDIQNLVDNTPGIKTSKEARAFKYKVRVQPKKEGTCEYGPYEIEVNGRKLRSPKVTLRVIAALDTSKDMAPSLSVDRSEIVLGESFQLTLEAYGQGPLPNPWLRETKSFDMVRGPIHGMGRTTPDGTIRQYRWSSWIIRPKQAGEFRFASDMFVGSTEELLDESLVVQVRSPSPLEGTK